ncbi:hypothetical protein FKM82_001655 [Ascaphus truei]
MLSNAEGQIYSTCFFYCNSTLKISCRNLVPRLLPLLSVAIVWFFLASTETSNSLCSGYIGYATLTRINSVFFKVHDFYTVGAHKTEFSHTVV